MKKIYNLKYEDMFKVSTTCLRINRSHPNIVRDKMWKLQFSLIMTISFSAFGFLSYSIILHDIKPGKFAELCKNLTMVIVFITITFKYAILLIHEESIKELIIFLESDYKEMNNYSVEDQETMLKYAKIGAKVCKYWLIASFTTSTIFPLKAFISMGYLYFKGEFKLVPMFEVTYPQIIDSYKNVPFVFWSLFLIALIFDFYASSMYVGFDPIVPIFMLHVSGQLVLLSRRMSKIFAEVENPKEIQEELKLIIIKLQKLYNFVSRMTSNFAILYEFKLKASTFLLPLTAYEFVEDMRNGWVNLEFISFFLTVILHFLLPSYYSDLLMEKNEEFRLAVYSSGWEKCPDKQVRQIILFMITRARIPMGIRTVFYEINLNTFAEMCRQSYTLFNLMNAAW